MKSQLSRLSRMTRGLVKKTNLKQQATPPATQPVWQPIVINTGKGGKGNRKGKNGKGKGGGKGKNKGKNKGKRKGGGSKSMTPQQGNAFRPPWEM